jgi:multiple sugar transport system permease protein
LLKNRRGIPETMASSSPLAITPREPVQPVGLDASRRNTGRLLIWAGSLLLLAVLAYQILATSDLIAGGFSTWRPVLFAYILWAAAIIFGQILIRGERGSRAAFVLPAVFFTVAVVIFPTFFGLYIAFTDWNLSSLTGRQFNGLDNLRSLWNDPFYWNALGNMVLYVLFVLVEYAIAFALALLLNADIKARKFFRVVFLLPFMLSPVAVSWMVGKSIMENRFGPLARFARFIGWENPAFFSTPWAARLSIEAMDAWVWIPFMVILLLAGLQALPKDVQEAATVDGASSWQTFWKITFPLMLPVSVTAIVLRIIFKLKLADIVINVTSGGPGGATDTVSSFIYREYRDRSNVGYGTMLAEFYLVIIVIFITVLLAWVTRWTRKYATTD